MRYAFLVFLVTTSARNRTESSFKTCNPDYPYQSASPFRHDIDILSQSKKHSIFLLMYESSAMTTWSKKLPATPIVVTSALGNQGVKQKIWDEKCQKIALESWIINTCDCATSKIPALFGIITPENLNLIIGKCNILKFLVTSWGALPHSYI